MQIDSDVLDVIRSGTVEGAELRLPGELDRKLYQRVNLALAAVGGKWDRYKRAHLFPLDAVDAIAGLLATGEVIADADRGYYPTPQPVVEQLLELACLEPGCEVLEPSAGRGAIAEPAAAQGAIVDCVELDPRSAEYIRAAGYARKVANTDFLSMPVKRRYHRAVMNPPFADRQDLRHVERALRFVRPGGLLVAVMSAGLTFRQDRLSQDFRARVREARGTITALPDNAFPAVGVRTVIVVLPVHGDEAGAHGDPFEPSREQPTPLPEVVQQGLFTIRQPRKPER
ncbi:class I SAM-dependent methyltransferase [Streptomyces sp. NPDC057638]|uniref:class I SAM-dependent methyltransferase n=1 Tax=Streptomyces sp. NPDC057638 TaxID=3346190 RepID=UPI0036982F74